MDREKNKNFIGIVKFFKSESLLDSLISGTFYCNTPEFYRHSKCEGISDKNESCLFSYRPERQDDEIILEFNGRKINNISRLTAYNPGLFESWLHCWMLLEFPETYEELEELKKNISQIHSEFGYYYGFVDYSKVDSFYKIIQSMTNLEVNIHKVKYSNRAIEFGPTCKNISFAYQREIRFLIGECASHIKDPIILNYQNGFKGHIQKCPAITLRLEGLDIPLLQS